MIILKIILWLYRKYIYIPTPPEDLSVPFGATDAPSPFEKIAPTPAKPVSMPAEFCLYEKAKAIGWKATKQDKNTCTGSSRITIAEIQNTIWNGVAIFLDQKKQWSEQEKTGGDIKWGDTIQNAWKTFKKFCQGYPETEHRRIPSHEVTVDILKRWLLLHRPIGTGMRWRWLTERRMMNYRYMKETGYYEPGSGKTYSGHADHVVGWSDARGAFKVHESEIEEWGEKDENEPGICWVKYENIQRLMSCYVSFDAIDKKHITKGQDFAVLRENGKVGIV